MWDPLGVRVTLAHDPANIEVKTLRKPKTLDSAIDHLRVKGLLTPGRAVPSCEEA